MRPAHVASSVRVRRRWNRRNNRHAATALARSLPPDPALNRCSRRSGRHMDNTLRGNSPGRKPESGIKEESVIIDDDDPEVPPPKVTVMKLVTMQTHRFRETDSVAVDHHVLVLVNRDVSTAVHPHISLTIGRQRTSRPRRFIEPLPVLQARIHIRSRRHGVRTNAGASHVLLHPRVAHRHVCPWSGCCVHSRCGPWLSFSVHVRGALNFLALRRQRQSKTSNAY